MGKLSPTSADTAQEAGTLTTGNFTATGTSTPAPFYGDFNVLVWGTFVATFQLERSFDGGVTWLVENLDSSGTAAAWSVPVSIECAEPEYQVLYRINCTSYTSGTINYRLSQATGIFNESNNR